MTLLTICQDAAKLIGITAPDAVTSSTDTSVLQLNAVANQEGRALVDRYMWQALVKEGSHTTLAAESQGTINTPIQRLPHIQPTTGYAPKLFSPMHNKTRTIYVLLLNAIAK